jgi:hypothetical protein
MQERFHEFAFEGLRYWDLLRQGVEAAAEIIAESNGVEVLSGGSTDKVIIQASHIINKRGLSQIPQTQINYSNNVLKQNEGW